MVKILSAEDNPKTGKNNILVSLWKYFQSFEHFTKVTITTCLLVILSTPFIVNNMHIFNSKAEGPENVSQPVDQDQSIQPQFSSNELLIKVTKEAKRRVHGGNPNDTGITTLDSFNSKKDPKAKYDFKIKSFERIAKEGKDSKTDSDLFSWYKVTFDAPDTLIEGKLNHAKEVVENNPANSGDKLHINNGQALSTLQQLINKLNKDPNIEDIDLNYSIHITVIPNDPYYSSTGSWGQSYDDLWGMKKINAAAAWDQATGSASIIVAGIDTGVDRNHEDIAANMWVNTNETPSNGVDDDSNGYVDDYYGWNFINNTGDPMDDHGHGTHTVGTIAGVGNNGVGVVGVNWTSKIMALKFLDYSGSGYLDDGIRALQYAADMGAKVSSNSWGGAGSYSVMDDAVMYEHDRGMVMVAAAANANSDALNYNPANTDGAITVAASDYNDAKASFSNWGEKIDVAAPGVDILSIRAANNPMCTAARTVGTNYCRVSGTSMATPHVAGLAALLLSKNPSLTNEEVRQIIRNGVDDLGTPGKDKDYGYGRINAVNSMNLSQTHPLTPWISSPRSRTLTGSSLSIRASIGGPNFSSYTLEYGKGRAPSSWTTINSSTTQPVTDTVLATIDPTQSSDDIYIFRLTATDTAGKTYQHQVNDILVDNFDNVITFPLGSVSLSNVDVYGTALTKNGLGFSNYKLEWSSNGGSTWSTSGMILVNNGSLPINGGKLGTWDTTGLTNGSSYILRLSVTAVNAVVTTSTTTVNADKDLVTGWPKAISSSNAQSYSSPVLADLNGDGKKDIIVGGGDGKLYAYQKDGSQLAGFPVSFSDALSFYVGPNVDDLNNDGNPEILAQVVTTAYTYKLYIVKGDGTLYPGWPTTSIMGAGTPTVADLDGDGSKDIVTMQVKTWVFETDFDLHAYNLNGTELAGFPKRLVAPPVGFDAGQIFPASNRGPLTIADLDRDRAPEIGFIFSERFYLFDNSGSVLPGWPFIVPPGNNYIYVFDGLSLSNGDLDGDGNLELFAQNNYTCSFIGGNLGGCYGGNVDSILYALHKDGSTLPGWPKTTASDTFYGAEPYPGAGWSPAVVDMDGDGKDDIVISDYRSGIRIFTHVGKKVIPDVGAGYTSSAITDVDGDGHLEVANSYYGSVGIYKDNGTAYLNKNVGGFINGSLVLGDIDNNGKQDLVAINAPYGSSIGVQGVYLWELNTVNPPVYEWPMFGHDPARTGRLLLGPQLPTPTLGPTSTPTPVVPTPSDNIPPVVSIASPLNNSTVTKNSTVSITAAATDNIGVTRVEFSVNGVLKCTDTISPYKCSWKAPAAKGKTYTLNGKAYDASNNIGLSPIVTVVSK